MNHIVRLDASAGELEKILSGTKTMIVNEFDPAGNASPSIIPGDSLYFLRDEDHCSLRVVATVVRVLVFTNHTDEDLSQILKEIQPRLQLTEDQYNHWFAKRAIITVEFEAAHKIPVLHVAPERITDRLNWIAFKEFSEIMEL